MKLRKLKLEDQDAMLEWMENPKISCFFRFDYEDINKDSVVKFIMESEKNQKNKHYAIVEDGDEYLGTISLKNIDFQNGNAEYAISLREKAIGKNIARQATDLILYIAFIQLELHKVYLNVTSENVRAIRFYEKYGFIYEGEFLEHLIVRGVYKNLKWYGIFKNDFIKTNENQIEIIKFKTQNEQYIIDC